MKKRLLISMVSALLVCLCAIQTYAQELISPKIVQGDTLKRYVVVYKCCGNSPDRIKKLKIRE